MGWKIHFLLLLGVLDLARTAPVYFNKRLEEAEQIALESTGLLQPLDSVVRRIMRDLKSIRDEYPAIQDVVHKKKWIAGEVVVQSITDDQISEIDDSRLFGPLQQVRRVRSGSTRSVLVFSNAYHPERIAEKLYEKFGVRAEPNTNSYDFDANGSITYNPSTATFVIEKKAKHGGYGAFRNKFLWELSVRNGKVNLLRSIKPGFDFTG